MRRCCFLLIAVLGFSLGACESGTYSDYTFQIDATVLAQLSPATPGLLMLEPGTPVAPLCPTTAEPLRLTFEIDDGFGCLPDNAEDSARTALVVPIPDAWDPAAFCALGFDKNTFVMLPPEMPLVTGIEGTAIARVRVVPRLDEDASPCGGTLEYAFELTAL